jgi:hypothetical protein
MLKHNESYGSLDLSLGELFLGDQNLPSKLFNARLLVPAVGEMFNMLRFQIC